MKSDIYINEIIDKLDIDLKDIKLATSIRFINMVRNESDLPIVKVDVDGNPYYVDSVNNKILLKVGDIILTESANSCFVLSQYKDKASWVKLEISVPDYYEMRCKEMEAELSGKTFQEICKYVVDNYVDIETYKEYQLHPAIRIL